MSYERCIDVAADGDATAEQGSRLSLEESKACRLQSFSSVNSIVAVPVVSSSLNAILWCGIDFLDHPLWRACVYVERVSHAVEEPRERGRNW